MAVTVGRGAVSEAMAGQGALRLRVGWLAWLPYGIYSLSFTIGARRLQTGWWGTSSESGVTARSINEETLTA